MGNLRRNNIEKNSAVEKEVRELMNSIERLGADERLTKAITNLDAAFNNLADWYDDYLDKCEQHWLIELPKLSLYWNGKDWTTDVYDAKKYENELSALNATMKKPFYLNKPFTELLISEHDFINN